MQTNMINSNDESDKPLRQKNYYLTVFIMPVLLAAIICTVLYYFSSKHMLSATDSYYGYFLSLSIALIVYGFNRKNWLRMPDGTFHHIQSSQPTHQYNPGEPKMYDEEYFNSKGKKANMVVLGLVMTGLGIFLAIKSEEYVIIPMVIISGGIFLAYQGISGLKDRSPKLKLAKKGLWTSKLGFRDWKEISQAQVIEDKSGKTPEYILEIYLYGTEFAVAGKPDERLYLTELENYQYVEMVIENFISKRNELKT